MSKSKFCLCRVSLGWRSRWHWCACLLTWVLSAFELSSGDRLAESCAHGNCGIAFCLSTFWKKEEVLKIRNKIDVFAEELQGFCHEFREKCPFDPANAMNGEYDLSYETMNEQPDFRLGRPDPCPCTCGFYHVVVGVCQAVLRKVLQQDSGYSAACQRIQRVSACSCKVFS